MRRNAGVCIHLPARRGPSSNGFRTRTPPRVAHAPAQIRGAVRALQPVAVRIVAPGSDALRWFTCLVGPSH